MPTLSLCPCVLRMKKVISCVCCAYHCHRGRPQLCRKSARLSSHFRPLCFTARNTVVSEGAAARFAPFSLFSAFCDGRGKKVWKVYKKIDPARDTESTERNESLTPWPMGREKRMQIRKSVKSLTIYAIPLLLNTSVSCYAVSFRNLDFWEITKMSFIIVIF